MSLPFITRPQSLRRHLMLLVVGVLLPISIFALILVWQLQRSHRLAVDRRLTQASRDLAALLDREFLVTFRALDALASSERLERGDLDAFHNEASRVANAQPGWEAVILLDTAGQQLVNTAVPRGTVLGLANDMDSFQLAVATGKPVVGNLIEGRQAKLIAFPVRIPIRIGGDIRYILTAVLTPAAMAELVGPTPAQGEWTRTIVDSRSTIVARTRNADRFVGRSATPSFTTATRATREGIYRDTSLEGSAAYLAFTRSRVADWTVAIVIPAQSIDAPNRRWIVAVAGIGVGTVVLSILAAVATARRISRSISAATDAADVLARGGRPVLPSSTVDEVVHLAAAFHRAADLLAQRETERNENLSRAQAALAEAEAAARAKDQFLAMLGHELRNPLGPVRSGVHLLGALPTTDPRFRTIHATVDRQVTHMTRIVDDLLDASRVARGSIELRRTVFDLARLTREVVTDFAAEFDRAAIRIAVSTPETTVAIHGDRTRIAQCLGNLLHNALKFTPAGGTVQVTLTQDPYFADLACHDTGAGIDPMLLPELFTPFAQAPQNLGRSTGGLGLGLALVKGFCEMHGGTVAARSDGPGKGASFHMRLPVTNAPLDPVAPQGLTPPEAAGEGAPAKRVLVVEDHDDAARTLAMLLRMEGHEVHVAGTAREALNAAPAVQPDVIICDIGLPDLDGYALCREFRATAWGRAVRLIALTGYGQASDVARSRDAGFDLHLTKPVDITALKVAVGGLGQGACAGERGR